MGNTSSHENDNENDNSDDKSNDDTKLNQEDCSHGYNDGEYNFVQSDNLLNVHYKNEYNESLSGDKFGSGTVIGVVQDIHTVHTTPDKIADACNDCETKIPWIENERGTSDFNAQSQYGTLDSGGASDRASDKSPDHDNSALPGGDLGSERWQHRPDWRD